MQHVPTISHADLTRLAAPGAWPAPPPRKAARFTFTNKGLFAPVASAHGARCKQCGGRMGVSGCKVCGGVRFGPAMGRTPDEVAYDIFRRATPSGGAALLRHPELGARIRRERQRRANSLQPTNQPTQ
jgi:hypothetical protein